MAACAQTVQDGYSLWKALEKRKEIPCRKFLRASLNVTVELGHSSRSHAFQILLIPGFSALRSAGFWQGAAGCLRTQTGSHEFVRAAEMLTGKASDSLRR